MSQQVIARVLKIFICLLMLGFANLKAQVMLPESGRLAGAMDSAVTANGNEFLFFPWLNGPAARTFQSGWIEIDFDQPQGDHVDFEVIFKGRGSDTETTFLTGQTMVFTEEAISSLNSFGRLDLQSGEIEEIFINLAFENSIISTFGKLNRLVGTLGLDFPPPPAVLPPGLPPDFVFAEAHFDYDASGNITGFEFTGGSVLPIGILGFLPFVPQYAFGIGGQGFFANPAFCAESTPLAECPNDNTHPEGLPLDIDALIRPNATLVSKELREVPIEWPAPACAPLARADSVVVALEDEIYQIAGSGLGMDRGRVDIYNPATRIWRQGPPLLVAVTEAQGAVLDGKIYVSGGRRWPGGPATNVLQVFDPATQTWSRLRPSPSPIADGVAVAVGDQLYVLTGRTNRPNGSPSGNLRFFNQIQVYDPATNAWDRDRAVAEGSPIYLSGASAVAHRDQILLINGLRPDGEISRQVWIFDPATDNFVPGVPTLHGVYDAAAVRIGERIFLAGGRGEVGGPSQRGMQVFETALGTWKQALEQPSPLASTGGAEVADTAYFLGGRTMTGTNAFPGPESGVLQAYAPDRGWQVCDSYPIYTSGDVFNAGGLGANSYHLAPGTQASISGFHLANDRALAPPDQDVPTNLAGVEVTVDGLPAPLLAVSPSRIDFQIPYSVSPLNGVVDVQVHREGSPLQAPLASVPLMAEAPGLFIQSCGTTRDVLLLDGAFALACHPDGSLNYTRNTVQPGEPLILQMTGLGAVDPPLPEGARAPDDTPVQAITLPEVRVEGEGGQMLDATVISAILAPGEVGIYDVTILIPDGARRGSRVLVEASINGLRSNQGAISVGRVIEGDAAIPCQRDTVPIFRLCGPLS